MTSVRRSLSAALFAACALLLAGPLLAELIAGCAMPLILKPAELSERTWEARDLGLFLKEGVGVEFRTERRELIAVAPKYELHSRDRRTPVLTTEGKAVDLRPGKQALGRVMPETEFDQIGRLLAGGVQQAGGRMAQEGGIHQAQPGGVHKSGPFRVIDARVLEHEQELRWPDRRATRALTVSFVDAKPDDGKRTQSHKLVLFLAEAEELDRR